MSTDAYDLTFADGYVTPGRRRNNWVSSNTPTVNDDLTYRWEIGSVWVNGSNIWMATSVTAGAAKWMQLDGDGVGGSGSEEDHTLHTDASVSGAHTVDRVDGATHDLTLTGDATITFDGATVGEATDWRLVIRQDSTGSRTITWADTIEWVGGSAPTLQTGANDIDVIGIVTVDDGATYLGFHAGSSGALDYGEDADISDLAFGDVADSGVSTEVARADHVHGMPTASSGGIGPLLISDDHSTPIVFEDILLTEEEDDFLYADP